MADNGSENKLGADTLQENSHCARWGNWRFHSHFARISGTEGIFSSGNFGMSIAGRSRTNRANGRLSR